MKHVHSIFLLIAVYFAAYFVLEGIPYGIGYAERDLPKFLKLLLILPLVFLKVSIVAAVLFGLFGSFYLWWKKRPTYILLKLVVWFERIVVVFLSSFTLVHLGFLMFDFKNTGEVALASIRYNVFNDMGLKSAAALYAYACVERFAIQQCWEARSQ